jgi:hypothetical protein
VPYEYGNDGNWLVTSFLKSGEHTFIVRALMIQGKTAMDRVRARVSTAPRTPARLAATWTRVVTPGKLRKATSSQPPPTGRWMLRIDRMGWLRDPTPGATCGLFDVAYATGRTLQMRPTIEYPPYPNRNNGGFCDDTDPPASWTYTIARNGKTLTLDPTHTLAANEPRSCTEPGHEHNHEQGNDRVAESRLPDHPRTVEARPGSALPGGAVVPVSALCRAETRTERSPASEISRTADRSPRRHSARTRIREIAGLQPGGHDDRQADDAAAPRCWRGGGLTARALVETCFALGAVLVPRRVRPFGRAAPSGAAVGERPGYCTQAWSIRIPSWGLCW